MENLKNVAPIEDFNWDAYENGESVASASHEELEKAYDNTLNKVNDREVVDGTVIAMNKREVVVNIGYKSDGIIPMSEFRYNPELKVGDTVEVYIENQEDKKGQLVLSHRKARATRSWDRVNAALENEEIMKLEDSIRDIAHALLTRVLDKGARDNTTIILCEVRADNRPFKTWLLQKKG